MDADEPESAVVDLLLAQHKESSEGAEPSAGYEVVYHAPAPAPAMPPPSYELVAPIPQPPIRSFILMVVASDIVSDQSMIRPRASTLEELVSELVSTLGIVIPTGMGVDIALADPQSADDGRVVRSLTELPAKAKVRLSLSAR